MKINVSSYIKILCFSVIMVSVLFSSAVFPCASASSNYSGTVLSNRSTIDNALAGTVVNCMLQDSTGFLWFGTQAGLYRYNGYSLKSYIFSSNSSSKFNSNFITSICEDNLKNIWIGTFGGGVFKLDSQTGEYINFNSNSQGPDAISDNNIRTIYMDGGKLWIGTQNKGLDCLDLASRHFTHYKNIIDNADSISSNAITSICKDSTGTLWVGTIGGGLNKLDSQSDKFVRIKLQDNYSDIIPNPDKPEPKKF